MAIIALVTIVILWFGPGFNAKLFFVFVMTVSPILINTVAGVRNGGQSLVDVALAEMPKRAETAFAPWKETGQVQ